MSNVIEHPFAKARPLVLDELDPNEEIQVGAARQLLLSADYFLSTLKTVPAATLAKVRIDHVDDDGRDGVMGAVGFLDHLRASAESTLLRLRVTVGK